MLPIVHATVEELSIYLYGKLLAGFDPQFLLQRGIHTMEVNLSEAPGQDSTFRYRIPEPSQLSATSLFDVTKFINKGKIKPLPCSAEEATAAKEADEPKEAKEAGGPCRCEDCDGLFSMHFERVLSALNRRLDSAGDSISTKDLVTTLREASLE